MWFIIFNKINESEKILNLFMKINKYIKRFFCYEGWKKGLF